MFLANLYSFDEYRAKHDIKTQVDLAGRVGMDKKNLANKERRGNMILELQGGAATIVSAQVAEFIAVNTGKYCGN